MFGKQRTTGNSAIAKIEGDLAALMSRRQWLDEQLAMVRRDASAAMGERRRLLTEGDVTEDARKAVDQRIASAQTSETGLMDAIEHVDAVINEAEQRLAGERDRIVREAEAVKRAKDAAALEAVAAEFDASCKRLVGALATVSAIIPMGDHVQRVIERLANDIGGTVGESVALVRGYSVNVLAGSPLLVQSVPLKTAKAPVVERRSIMLRRPSRWVDPEHGVQAAGQLRTVEVPTRVAELALRFDHAVLPGSNEAQRLLQFGSPEYAPVAVTDTSLIDLEKPAPPKSEPRSSGVMHSIADLDARERTAAIR